MAVLIGSVDLVLGTPMANAPILLSLDDIGDVAQLESGNTTCFWSDSEGQPVSVALQTRQSAQ